MNNSLWSFEDRVAMLVERQWLWKENRALATRLKYAQLRQTACMEDLDYRHPRGLQRSVIEHLAGAEWRKRKRLRNLDLHPAVYGMKKNVQRRSAPRVSDIIGTGGRFDRNPQNVLVENILKDFAPVFAPAGRVLYVGDTDTKFAYFDKSGLGKLGIHLEEHGKMPDVIIHYTKKNWLLLIEAVTSHKPVSPKRHQELKHLFSNRLFLAVWGHFSAKTPQNRPSFAQISLILFRVL